MVKLILSEADTSTSALTDFDQKVISMIGMGIWEIQNHGYRKQSEDGVTLLWETDTHMLTVSAYDPVYRLWEK
jgi:hypothetical protein